MATHSSILAWRIPGTEEPSGLPSMGSHRVRHDWSDLAAVHSIFQTRTLGWVAISSCRGSSWPTDGTHVSWVSCTGRQIVHLLSHLGSPIVIHIQTHACLSTYRLSLDGHIKYERRFLLGKEPCVQETEVGRIIIFPMYLPSMHVLASQKNFKKNKRTTERGGEGRDWGRIEEMRPTEYKMRVLPTSFLNSNGQYVLKALKCFLNPCTSTSDNSSWNTEKHFLYKDIQELIRSIFIYLLKLSINLNYIYIVWNSIITLALSTLIEKWKYKIE